MKALRIISILLLVLFCLSSCSGGSGAGTPTEPNTPPESSEPVESNPPENNFTDTSEADTIDLINWFHPPVDPDRQDLPSYETLDRIVPLMTAREVYMIAGYPQRMAPGLIKSSHGGNPVRVDGGCEYDSSDGRSIWISWRTAKDGTFWVAYMMKDGLLYSYHDSETGTTE